MFGWFQRLFSGPTTGDRLGKRGERAAEAFLKARGHQVIARSLRLKIGELDLVTIDRQTVVFVEVKTRTSDRKGEPWQAVGKDKQRRVTKSAAAFLKLKHLTDRPVRFDIISVTIDDEGGHPARVEHFEDAFPAAGPWSF